MIQHFFFVLSRCDVVLGKGTFFILHAASMPPDRITLTHTHAQTRKEDSSLDSKERESGANKWRAALAFFPSCCRSFLGVGIDVLTLMHGSGAAETTTTAFTYTPASH